MVLHSVKVGRQMMFPLDRHDVVELCFPAARDGPGKAVWDFVCDVVCEDLCQPTDLPIVLQEQKSVLVQAFAVLQALYRCQDQWRCRSDTSKWNRMTSVRRWMRPGHRNDLAADKEVQFTHINTWACTPPANSVHGTWETHSGHFLIRLINVCIMQERNN